MPVELSIPRVESSREKRKEHPESGRVILLPGKGVFTLGSAALGIAAAITYNPGDMFEITGGITNREYPHLAESTFVELIATRFDPSLPSGIFVHENLAKNSWQNIENSRPKLQIFYRRWEQQRFMS